MKINISSDQYFSCTSCGKCCRSEWRVKVEPQAVPAITSSQVYQKLERQGYQPLRVVDGQHQVARREDGSCHFLSERGCEVHAELGASMKPSVCQLYPFALVNTPDGYFLSASYSCPAVIAGTGSAVSEQLDGLTEIVKNSPYFSDDDTFEPPTITISENTKIPWSEYLVMEKTMLESIGSVDPVRDIIHIAASLAAGGKLNPDGQPSGHHHWNSLLTEEALNLLPMFAANSMSVLERDGVSDRRKQFSLDILNHPGTHSNLLHTPLPQFRYHKPTNLMTTQVINRYIRNLVWGKRLVCGPTLVTRLLVLATSISILLFYLDALAEGKANHHFSFDDLEWCFDLIESSLITHANDLEPTFLEYERAIMAILDVLQTA